MVSGKCLFFDEQRRTYKEAQKKCATVFGPGLPGRLYEPQTLIEHNIVCSEADNFFKSQCSGKYELTASLATMATHQFFFQF